MYSAFTFLLHIALICARVRCWRRGNFSYACRQLKYPGWVPLSLKLLNALPMLFSSSIDHLRLTLVRRFAFCGFDVFSSDSESSCNSDDRQSRNRRRKSAPENRRRLLDCLSSLLALIRVRRRCSSWKCWRCGCDAGGCDVALPAVDCCGVSSSLADSRYLSSMYTDSHRAHQIHTSTQTIYTISTCSLSNMLSYDITSYHIISFAKAPLIRSTGAPQYTTGRPTKQSNTRNLS